MNVIQNKTLSIGLRLLLKIICLFFLAYGTNSYSQVVAHFNFDEPSGTISTLENVSQTLFPVSNHFNNPEKIQGIHGNAMRLDGYSTWASNNGYQIEGITNKITITAWYATESFNKENGAIISQLDGNSGFSLEVGPFGNVGLTFFVNGEKQSIFTAQKLEKYKWNYIAGIIDLQNAITSILVNGSEWTSMQLDPGGTISLSNTTIYVGRHNYEIRNGGFLLTALNGALDDLTIYNDILPYDSIAATYLQSASLTPDLTIDPYTRYSNDHLRPKYHAMPNACWTNEPYGLSCYNGKYHLFFQKNPNSPTLYFMHWGHLTSPDLVKWTEEKIALAPSPGFDSFGVWSGTTIKDSTQKPVIIYTGVDGVKAGIGAAYSFDEDLQFWTKNPMNPLIPSPPSGYQHMDFRDPFVWKSGNAYYMIVGSGIQNSGGGILFTYKSQDLVNWINIAPLYRHVYVNEAGYFWEMPFFFPLNDNNEYILGVNPIPTQGIPAQTLYWIGKWENEKFKPYFSSPKKLELINSLLLSPSINLDSSGRITYIGIIPEDRDASSQIQAEWRHLFSLPRVVRMLKDSAIGQIPHPNLCRLRDSLVTVSGRTIMPGTGNNLPEIQGTQTELSFKIKADPGTKFTIQLFKHSDSQEFTSVIFDLSTNNIAFDRAHSSLSSGTPKDFRSNDYVFNFNDTITVNIFLDHSTIEVFVDNITVFSFRVYPTRVESRNVDFIVNKGKAEIVYLEAWSLDDMRSVSSLLVCEPENLPNKFRKPGESYGLPDMVMAEHLMNIYPNPSNDILNIEVHGSQYDTIMAQVKNLTGTLLIQQNLAVQHNNKYLLNISALTPGNYILTVICKEKVYSKVFTFVK